MKATHDLLNRNDLDGTLDHIEAVGFLETIPHKQVSETMVALARKLAPGGDLTATVPDFEWASSRYAAGEPIDVQSLVMGEDGQHCAIFDREALHESMALAGFERIVLADAPSGYFSLRGFKPHLDAEVPQRCAAILSGPRYGPLLHFQCAMRAFGGFVPYDIHRGAFWHQILSNGMEQVIADYAPEFIFTTDFDTAFSRQDVFELYRLMRVYPDADCIAPIQANRGKDAALFTIADENGVRKSRVFAADFARNLTRVYTAHFGLTIFRVSSLLKLPRPWMNGLPAGDGRWNEGDPARGIHGKTDPDIVFWQNWHKAGLSLYLANHVQIGHLVEAVKWVGPTHDRTFYQDLSDYNDHGMPKEALR